MSELTKTLSITRIWQKKLVEWKDDISHLIYPNCCLICDSELPNKNIPICHFCENDLPYTLFESYTHETNMDKLFWGRVPVASTYSLLYFEKETSTQAILHGIKYQNKKKLAIEFGKRIGKQLSQQASFDSIDCLLPIPLHPKKEYLRGYNQSLLIAEGISLEKNLPIETKGVKRIKHGESQTKKSRFKRWDNVQNTFRIDPKLIGTYKHIALVDDVVTTGATIEACINEINEIFPNLKISIITLAIAK